MLIFLKIRQERVNTNISTQSPHLQGENMFLKLKLIRMKTTGVTAIVKFSEE